MRVYLFVGGMNDFDALLDGLRPPEWRFGFLYCSVAGIGPFGMIPRLLSILVSDGRVPIFLIHRPVKARRKRTVPKILVPSYNANDSRNFGLSTDITLSTRRLQYCGDARQSQSSNRLTGQCRTNKRRLIRRIRICPRELLITSM